MNIYMKITPSTARGSSEKDELKLNVPSMESSDKIDTIENIQPKLNEVHRLDKTAYHGAKRGVDGVKEITGIGGNGYQI